jgi:hypothetical protein
LAHHKLAIAFDDGQRRNSLLQRHLELLSQISIKAYSTS